MIRLTSATADQRGMVLPLTLMFVIILTTLSVALLTVGGHETLVAANHLKGVHALFLAEAGLEDAFNTLRNDTTKITSATSSLATLTGTSGPGSSLTAYGGYTVQYQSAGSSTVRVVVEGYTGTSSNKTSTRTVRAILSQGWTSTDAVRTKDDLTIIGSVEVEGSCGSVHTNTNLTLTGGSIDIDVTATASGTATGTYQAEGQSGSQSTSAQGGQSSKTIPTISPSSVLTSAKSTLSSDLYQLKSDGRVLDKNDALVTTVANNGTFSNTWKYSGGAWSIAPGTNTGTTGTYYIEGDVTISGSPGSSSSPWNATIIATGYINMAGSPYMSAHLTDTLLVAGTDIEIGGGPHLSNGVIAAHEQISISGNIELTGSIVTEDGGTTGTLVTANRINGNVEITYQCGLSPPFPGALTILAWGF